MQAATGQMQADPPFRQLSDSEFAMVGRIILVWGMHEQLLGSIICTAMEVARDARVPLVHTLAYSKKADMACDCLEARGDKVFKDLAKELRHIKQVYRPERDTLAHGAFGMWADDVWVRAIAKDRFVIFDDLNVLFERAHYAQAIAMEAVIRVSGGEPTTLRRSRPSAPSGRIPDGWSTARRLVD